MFIRAYLRASTKEQDASRAKQSLIDFASDHGHKIAGFYTENESGSTLARPELLRLIADAGTGDVILVEQIDRLARLNADNWLTLKTMLADKRLLIVSPELPTSYISLKAGTTANISTDGMSLVAGENGVFRVVSASGAAIGDVAVGRFA